MIPKELIGAFRFGTEKTIIGRVLSRKEYPYKILCREIGDMIGKGKYTFVRKHQAYFGIKNKSHILKSCLYLNLSRLAQLS